MNVVSLLLERGTRQTSGDEWDKGQRRIGSRSWLAWSVVCSVRIISHTTDALRALEHRIRHQAPRQSCRSSHVIEKEGRRGSRVE